MDNFERIHELNKNELAWFLMAYSDGCRCCIHKQMKDKSEFVWRLYGCQYGEHKDTCIEGHKKWLDREPDEDDELMYRLCKNNDILERWQMLSNEFKDGLKLKYENGLVVGIEQAHEADLPDAVLPF